MGFFSPVLAQKYSPYEQEIKAHSTAKQYTEVIGFAKYAKELNDSSLYRIGRAYLREKDQVNARKFFDLTLAQNPRYQNAWYFRGVISRYESAFKETLADAKKAIEIDSTDADYYFLEGDAYWELKEFDKARMSFEAATRQKDCALSAWAYIGELYTELEQPEKAAKAFRDALPHVQQDTAMYLRCLYNLGVNEHLTKHFDLAEQAFTEVVRLNPMDYRGLSKLIQAQYAQKKYKSADLLKKQIYDGWKAGKLPESMKEDFCFDQFEWKGKRVLVYERFAESGDLYYKHVFYLLDEKGNDVLQVQTEYSFAIAMSGKKYTLGKNEGKTHFTFIQFLFEENFNYDDLKSKVIRILEGGETASSSSTIRN